MKLHRWKDERYPDYTLDEPSDIRSEEHTSELQSH